MSRFRASAALILGVVLVACVYGWWNTVPVAVGARPGRAGAERPAPTEPVVDRTALDTAKRVQGVATSPDEQRLADAIVTTADHMLDLAFAAALREATEHPAPLSPAAKVAQARVDEVARRLVADNLQIQRLAEAVAGAKADRSGEIDGELALARAQFEVDQDDFNQAAADLIAEGGDLRGKIQALVAEHQAAAASKALPPAQAPVRPGLIHLIGRWTALRRKERTLATAKAQAAGLAAALASERANVTQRIRAHSRDLAAVEPAGSVVPRAAEVSAALLATARLLGADQKVLGNLSERQSASEELTKRYSDWCAIAAAQSEAALHQVLFSGAIILAVCLLLLFFDGWLGAAFEKLRIDRRQVETLRTVTTVALQIAAVVFILLVIIGPPGQLATFLGLAGAGLTVALKDFIVAFVGWLVLMGKNGIRLGDWVEINGVSGEVVELGMFHTVLLETGNWTDTGHPTGRRVTFTNSFAIEGHYFNFSTTGQWLWDELQLVVPAGQDLYAMVDAISSAVKDATADNARQAEEEWRRAAPTRKTSGITAAPAINVKPIVGGTEISLRYITRANERFRLRAALYQKAVELLGQKPLDSGHDGAAGHATG